MNNKENNETILHICGMSMEMQLAEEMGTIGKCKGCLYLDILRNDARYCKKKDTILYEEKTDCEEWVVDHR